MDHVLVVMVATSQCGGFASGSGGEFVNLQFYSFTIHLIQTFRLKNISTFSNPIDINHGASVDQIINGSP